MDYAAEGQKWRRKRRDREKSMRQIAEHMGFTVPYIADLERGRRNWNDRLREAYAAALDA